MHIYDEHAETLSKKIRHLEAKTEFLTKQFEYIQKKFYAEIKFLTSYIEKEKKKLDYSNSGFKNVFGISINKVKNIHPGEILLKEFLEPLKLSQSQLAKHIGVHTRRINEVIHGKRGITANTALLLAKYFDISPEFWMALQRDYELEEERGKLKKRLNKIEPLKRCG